MRVLVARLQDVDLPEPLRPTLVQVTAHWAGQAGDLRGENVRVWQYIKATYPSGADVATRDGRAARALLCVLQPEGNDEARSMTAEWFAAMTNDQSVSG